MYVVFCVLEMLFVDMMMGDDLMVVLCYGVIVLVVFVCVFGV